MGLKLTGRHLLCMTYTLQHDLLPFLTTSHHSLTICYTQVWGLGSHTPHFSLEGHEKGVNCIDYYPGGDKPYLLSGADDNQVRACVLMYIHQCYVCKSDIPIHSYINPNPDNPQSPPPSPPATRCGSGTTRPRRACRCWRVTPTTSPPCSSTRASPSSSPAPRTAPCASGTPPPTAPRPRSTTAWSASGLSPPPRTATSAY